MSTISNVLYVVGTVCLLVYAARTIKNPNDLPLFVGWRTLPLTFGSVVFTYEGIGVVSLFLVHEMEVWFVSNKAGEGREGSFLCGHRP